MYLNSRGRGGGGGVLTGGTQQHNQLLQGNEYKKY